MLQLQNKRKELRTTDTSHNRKPTKILTLPRQKQTMLSKHEHELGETKIYILRPKKIQKREYFTL